MVLQIRGDNPAIYLLLPLEDVNISVTLSPQWSFKFLFPLTELVIDPKHNTSPMEWTVSVQGESMADHATGSMCSYLFWEAETSTDPAALSKSISATPAAKGGEEVFDPSAPSLTPKNACVLPYLAFMPRLEKALERLRLTPARRTEFIVYWLPRFQETRDKGLYIAFRFVYQNAFAKAAKIEVKGCPAPAAIARISCLGAWWLAAHGSGPLIPMRRLKRSTGLRRSASTSARGIRRPSASLSGVAWKFRAFCWTRRLHGTLVVDAHCRRCYERLLDIGSNVAYCLAAEGVTANGSNQRRGKKNNMEKLA